MIGLLQRVSNARVQVNGASVGSIGPGLLVFVGVEQGDDQPTADRLLQRILGYRVFVDADGKMNLSLTETGGGLLLVPQFTLAADTRRGMRPSFTRAAPSAEGQEMFQYLLTQARVVHQPVACGIFGADMQVSLTNNGPVTFWLRVGSPAGVSVSFKKINKSL